MKELFFSVYFFFSSRRRHTRCSRDWSSDVCSSDLYGSIIAIFTGSLTPAFVRATRAAEDVSNPRLEFLILWMMRASESLLKTIWITRSEERRVGKECRSRWSPYH